MFLKIFSCLLPWPLRRRALQSWFGFSIHPSARIGLAWIFPKQLVMAANSKIDHFTVAIHLDRIEMEENASIGRSNWITGFPTYSDSPHFKHQEDRRAELILKESASVTKKHHIDCTSSISIGRFATIAGYQSQLLTHSIDLFENRQHSEPILIGDYAFVGTNVVVLGGASLPSCSVLGAKSLLNKAYSDAWAVYGGVPARKVADLPTGSKYFSRTDWFVY
jgi:acetyltransferase-like isoleucine patch superfamily enzyme